jgi:dienelactone hydrolase
MTGAIAAALLAAAPPLFAELAPGPHAVGFAVDLQHDPSRVLAGAARPVQLSIWFPAKTHGGPLRLRDYVGLAAGERGTWRREDQDLAVADQAAFLRQAAQLEPAEAQALLDQPLLARENARPLGPRFPLLLIAQGNGQSASDQAVLCEWLASHGHVVASTPSPMRLSGPLSGVAAIAARAEEQAADLAFALGVLRDRPDVDATRLAVIGQSFGARSALLFAMQEPAVRAMVSLDGGIGSRAGQAQLASSRLFDPERARFPLLHLYEEQDEFMAPDFALLRKLGRSHRLLARAAHLRHSHFTALGHEVALFPKLAAATKADAQTPRAARAVLQAVRRFLDAAPGAADVREVLRDLPDLALIEDLPAQEP